MSAERCENCKFLGMRKNDQGQIVAVLCRRKPPEVVAQFLPVGQDEQGRVRIEVASNTFWPAVNPQDWCGEYAPAIEVASAGRLLKS